jgi:hypothetical protein
MSPTYLTDSPITAKARQRDTARAAPEYDLFIAILRVPKFDKPRASSALQMFRMTE